MQTAMAEQRTKYNNDTGEVFSNKLALAIIVIASGFLLMLTGIVLSAISFVSHGRFHGWNVITLVASFIFLALGSHFLDRADAEKKKARLEFDQKYLIDDAQIKSGKPPEK